MGSDSLNKVPYSRNGDARIVSVISGLHAEAPASAPTLRSLSKILKISESYLRHRFKDLVGLSYGQYVRKLRFQHAKALLERGNVTVKQAMLEVGMLDHSSFARGYKKYFGESPTCTKRASSFAKGRALAIPLAAAKVYVGEAGD